VWTVNDIRKARSLFALGIDGIITDDPAALTGEFGP
jgi:glycerophosphoryl diester phosphodiesterase